MAWPKAVFDAPVLRGLDAASRDAVIQAGRLFSAGEGDTIYREDDASDSLFVVVSGSVELSAVRRGDDERTVVRLAARGDTFGEEATLAGVARRTTARAEAPAEIAEIPVAVLRRVVGRSEERTMADRERRVLERAAVRDLLGTLAFTRELTDDDLGLVLDAARFDSVERGVRIYGVGDRPRDFFLIADGLVQLQTEDEGRIDVRAYLTKGDFFGDEELLADERRRVTAVAMGECQLLRLPGDLLRTLSDRNPGMLRRIRRIAADRSAMQQKVVDGAAAKVAGSTQHVFKDLYRMQMARSMLVIDQDTCVRCGHCAWSCAELHGVSRLVRRGDKVITRLAVTGQRPRSLGLPNSCQHCKNPVCMIDCPTGAIGRDPEGEVFIREELCTGCGNCAKACPWENIRMAERTGDVRHEPGPGTSAEVAVKCDLCRDYDGPACVQACPTESIFRLEPTQDFEVVGKLLGESATRGRQARGIDRSEWIVAAAATVAVALGVVGAVLLARDHWRPGVGAGYGAGILGAIGIVALAAYAFPKRLVSLWMKAREEKSAARKSAETSGGNDTVRSKVRPLFVVHVALGLLAAGAVAAHGGFRFGPSTGGALNLAFWATTLLGGFGAFAYRALPSRLARLERNAALPEDLSREREALFDRLYRDASGADELLKTIVDKVLVPYARSAFGPFQLAASGRSLYEEQDQLKQRIEKLLEGRGGDRLDGLDPLVRTVVELRALPIRRLYTLALRGWLPLHMVLTGIVVVLLFLHVVSVIRF